MANDKERSINQKVWELANVLAGQGVEYKKSYEKIICESTEITKTAQQERRSCHEAPTLPELQSLFQK